MLASIRSFLAALGTKASEAAPIIYRMYMSQPWGVYRQRNPAHYSEEAYKKNSVAYAAIGRVARACAYVPIKLRRVGGANIERHPLLDLVRRPNPWQSGRELMEALTAYFLLTGDIYLEGLAPSDGAPPRELWALRPDRVRVVPGQYGPMGYVYEVGGTRKTWDCDPITGKSPILHVKTFNPLSDWYGMSPVEAAAYAIDQHNMAGEWNQALLQNSGRPSGAMVYTDKNGGTLSDKQFARIKEEINTSMAGSKNAGRIPILDGGLDWRAMSMSPTEMDWVNGKNQSARDICLVFDVPPMLLGIPGDNTYSNYKEARQAFYEDAVLPKLDCILEALNHWLAPAYGEGLELYADVDSLPALEPKREARWTAIKDAAWMTINEKRKATGLEPVADKEADALFVPSGLMPLAGSMDAPELDEADPASEDEAEDSADEEATPPVGKKPGKVPPKGKQPATGGGKAPGKKYIWETLGHK